MKKLGMIAIAGFSLLATNVLAAIKSEPVQYEYDGTKLTGYLYYDDAATEKRPGVMVVHEWWGLNDYAKHRAEMLAELGYVAFAADMYGDGHVTDKPDQAREWMTAATSDVDAWRGTALAGLEQLKKSDKVDPAKLAAIGYCFGGGTVLQTAYSGTTDLKGIVSFHGSLPSAPDGTEINTKVLAFHGNADAMVPPDTVAKFEEQMEKTGANWEFVAFGGARHAFTNPDAGKYGIENLQYNETADKRSWQGMQDFFKEIFQ